MAIEINDHIRRHLANDVVGWLTTVTPSGRPAPRPIWFYWDGETILIYSLNTGAKLRHIVTNNQVSLHFTGGDTGSDVVVISGTAALDPDAPTPSKHAELVAKYTPRVADMGQSFDWYDANYGTAIRVTPERVWEIGR